MKCNDVQNKILLNEEVSDPEVKKHLEECRVCTQFMQDFDWLVEEPFEVAPSDELDESVLNAVKEANTGNAPIQTQPQREVGLFVRRQLWIRVATAATVVMGVAIAALLLQYKAWSPSDTTADHDHNTEQSPDVMQMALIAEDVLSEQVVSETDEQVGELLSFNGFDDDLQDFEQQLGTLEEKSDASALLNISDS